MSHHNIFMFLMRHLFQRNANPSKLFFNYRPLPPVCLLSKCRCFFIITCSDKVIEWKGNKNEMEQGEGVERYFSLLRRRKELNGNEKCHLFFFISTDSFLLSLIKQIFYPIKIMTQKKLPTSKKIGVKMRRPETKIQLASLLEIR